jgi:saxitoxin biosynthesis operon SxtJ-like protein
MTRPEMCKLNRDFGLVIAGGCGVLALIRFLWSGTVNWWLMGIGLGFLVAGLLVPVRLEPLRRAWMKLAAVLGYVNSRILLTVVFAVVLTPTALLLRVLGRRPVAVSQDRTAGTYWRKRRPEEFTPERMERQF